MTELGLQVDGTDPKLLRRAMRQDLLLTQLRNHWNYAHKRGLEVHDVCVDRVFPGKQNQCFMRCLITVSNGGHRQQATVFAELVTGNAQERAANLVHRLAKPHRAQLSAGDPEERICALPDLSLVLRLPGLDERIDGLKLLDDKQSVHDLLHRHGVDTLPSPTTSLLAHRLGKRAVMHVCQQAGRPATIKRCLTEHESLELDTSGNGLADGQTTKLGTTDSQASQIVKFYKMHSDRPARVYAAMRHLSLSFEEHSQHTRVVAPIGFDASLNAIIMEDLPGEVMDFCAGSDGVEHSRLCGQLLAQLHRTPLSDELQVTPRHGIAEELDVLRVWVARACLLKPDTARLLMDTLQRVEYSLSTLAVRTAVPIHRDFHEKQVLLHDGRAFLLDFDTLCAGDSGIDVGNFLAHAQLASLQSRKFGEDDYVQVKNAFLSAYAEICGTRTDSQFERYVSVLQATALLRLACLCVFQPYWISLLPRLVELAEDAMTPRRRSGGTPVGLTNSSVRQTNRPAHGE